ncbi:hypothetical protein CKW39_08915 [Kocuria sp. WRN011]|uniref:phage terminase small subunit n=1 Tax=Kocuria sp. WRN011 TaxID=2029858 RepID=UPI000BAEF104|nr:hypothetical protein [Kocuria sp. WRN011]PBB08470.1 hypothetical protein CKW39_08915 [Kocuria sp. WRN011]
MPQPKKHSSVRARGNKASTASVLRPGTVVHDAPELPTRRDEDGGEVPWQPQTLEWWEDLWAAPMSSEYHSSDKHALFVLAALMDEFWIMPSAKLAGEIRLQRQAFGLTPYDRRRLEWTIETAEEAKDRGTRRRAGGSTSRQPDEGDDPRLTLVQ